MIYFFQCEKTVFGKQKPICRNLLIYVIPHIIGYLIHALVISNYIRTNRKAMEIYTYASASFSSTDFFLSLYFHLVPVNHKSTAVDLTKAFSKCASLLDSRCHLCCISGCFLPEDTFKQPGRGEREKERDVGRYLPTTSHQVIIWERFKWMCSSAHKLTATAKCLPLKKIIKGIIKKIEGFFYIPQDNWF